MCCSDGISYVMFDMWSNLEFEHVDEFSKRRRGIEVDMAIASFA
jgi:hypothetical protein